MFYAQIVIFGAKLPTQIVELKNYFVLHDDYGLSLNQNIYLKYQEPRYVMITLWKKWINNFYVKSEPSSFISGNGFNQNVVIRF